MSDDPQEIADHLIKEHGLEGALEQAMAGTTAAQHQGDNYRLSVWREVKRALQERGDEA